MSGCVNLVGNSHPFFPCMLRHFAIISVFPLCLSANELERISVTAKPAQSLPLSHSRIDAEQLSLLGATHIAESLASQPGVWISRGNGQEHLTAIRSPVLTGAGACGAFLVSEDGIPIRASGFCNANQLFELNSEQAYAVDVYRGPGSSWYGSNAVHGIINLTSRPLPEYATSEVKIEAGPHQYQRGSFALGNPDFLAYGNLVHDGGYQASSGYEQQKINLAYQQTLGEWHVVHRLAATHLNQQTAGYISGYDAYRDKDLRRTNDNPDAYRHASSLRFVSSFSHQLDEQQSWQIRPYARWQQMDFLQHYVPWQAREDNSQQCVGLQTRYLFESEKLNWQAGMDAEVSEGELQEFQDKPFSPNIPQGMHYDYQVIARNLSPFASLTWQTDTQWQLTASLRFDLQQYDYRNHLSEGSACAESVSVCRFYRPDSQTLTYQQWSPSLAAQYALSASSHVYARVSRGYRAPQATELFRLQDGQEAANLDAEQLTSIESGLRGNWGTLDYDLALYWMDKQHLIFQDTERQNVSNGHTRHQGIEIALAGQLGTQWYWHATGNLAKHTYQSAVKLANENIAGNDMDTAPRQQFSARVGRRGVDDSVLELEWLHMGRYYLDPQNSASYPGHSLLHLRAQYPLSQNWQIGLRLINLTNRDYAERADIGFGQYRYFVGQPRSLYLSVSANWSS
ncbi:TonB-dependent receptor [Bowmanella yangjiangensis]